MTPEMSRPVAVGRIGSGETILVEADPAECERIARRLDIPALSGLRCRWALRKRHGGEHAFEAEGMLEAETTRICVVTLEPFPERVREAFSVIFVPETERDGEAEDDDPDSPDILSHDGHAIDLGEATVEQLALALDPFPRSPEADGAGPGEVAAAATVEATVPAGPFAALASRARRR